MGSQIGKSKMFAEEMKKDMESRLCSIKIGADLARAHEYEKANCADVDKLKEKVRNETPSVSSFQNFTVKTLNNI